MFNESKYTKLYYNLILKYTSTSGEKHHIIPKSLGGSNCKSNVCIVHARVHFILHRLLVKMTNTYNEYKKMNYALWRMMNHQSKFHKRFYIVTSHHYEQQRSRQKKFMTENNPMKNPVISSKFRHPRPEQSSVATKRNLEYCRQEKHPLRI